jgi:hypothetical protein
MGKIRCTATGILKSGRMQGSQRPLAEELTPIIDSVEESSEYSVRNEHDVKCGWQWRVETNKCCAPSSETSQATTARSDIIVWPCGGMDVRNKQGSDVEMPIRRKLRTKIV